MKTDQIINKAAIERKRWHAKGYDDGKFIIGTEIRDALLANVVHVSRGTVTQDTLMGFDYVVDTQNTEDINFCPIEDA